MAARDNILAKLRPNSAPVAHPGRFLWQAEYGDLKTRFESRFRFHDGEILSLAECEDLFDEAYIEPDAAAILRHESKTSSPIWQASVSVTTVVAAIAETGTIILESGSEKRRLASLTPEIHIALVRSDQIVTTLDDAIALMNDRTTVWITGPSRTADIEGILIKGVHGPKRVIVIWVD